MSLKALRTPVEEDRETYLPETLPQDDLDGHAWVAVEDRDMFPGDPEHGGRWFQEKHVCRHCRRVTHTTNRRTRPRIFTVRVGMHVAEACPKASRATKVKVWLRGWVSPGPARRS